MRKNKRILSKILGLGVTFAFTACCLVNNSQKVLAEDNDATPIENWSQFVMFCNNKSAIDGYLVNDISVDINDFTQIKTLNKNLDGAGKKIIVDNYDSSTTLFENIREGIVAKNLNVNLPICTYNYGRIENCVNNGNITKTVLYNSYQDMGGIAVSNEGNGVIIGCTNNGDIDIGEINSKDYHYVVGGIVGFNNGALVENCINNGMISCLDHAAGGIVGENYPGGRVVNCVNTANVTGNYRVGGIVGFCNGANISKSINYGYVRGTGDYIGGIVGWLEGGNILDSINIGDVEGLGETEDGWSLSVGDIFGHNQGGEATNTSTTNSVLGSIYGENTGISIVVIILSIVVIVGVIYLIGKSRKKANV